MEKQTNSPTFLDHGLAEMGGPRTTAFLNHCEKHLPRDDPAASLEGVFNEDERGRRHYPLKLWGSSEKLSIRSDR